MASFLAVILALLVVTYLHVVIGELVPKGIALSHAERAALFVSTPVRWFFVIARPLDLAARRSRRTCCCAASGSSRRAPSRGALRGRAADAAVELGRAGRDRARGAGDALKVFDFADKEVSDVMVPRPEVVAISIALPPRRR